VGVKVEISAEAERLARALMERGRVDSVEAAIETALRALQEFDAQCDEIPGERDDAWWADARAKVREADEDIAAGRVSEVRPDFFDQLRARVRQSAEARRHSA
jgi:hypothetical protein